MLAYLRLTQLMALIVVLAPIQSWAQSQTRPHTKVVALDRSENGILPILAGPPETVTMKSGYVVLDPGHFVGKHSTGQHEEILIVLEGHGEMLFHDGSTVELKAHTALYCPPETEHDVKNTGASQLRYVYVVADAR